MLIYTGLISFTHNYISINRCKVDTSSSIINIILLFQAARAFLHLLLFSISPAKAIINADIERWILETQGEETAGSSTWKRLVWLLWKYPEYRNLFYYRIKKDKKNINRILMEIANLFFAPMSTLYIYSPSIGEGLFIQHGFSTIIAANSLGKNCWINQQVTIGFSGDGESPTIGDNVQITAGAKVFGDITIGDNSLIGANAVVFKDVPKNCTVVGVPGYIVKRDGKKVKEPLE